MYATTDFRLYTELIAFSSLTADETLQHDTVSGLLTLSSYLLTLLRCV